MCRELVMTVRLPSDNSSPADGSKLEDRGAGVEDHAIAVAYHTGRSAPDALFLCQ